MASAPAASGQPEVFQASLAVERPYLRDVVRAVLGTILFHRVCGNLRPDSLSVATVTFPTPAEPALDELIAAKVDLVAKALLDGPPVADGTARRTKLYVSLYPTPLPTPPPSSRARPRPGTPSSASRSASPATSDARTAPSPTRRHHAVALAQAAPAAVTSALGWFSASARAALIGGDTPAEVPDVGAEGQEEEARVLEVLKERGARPWEGWCVEFEVLGEGGGRARAPTAGEERLRTQLNDFLLRALEWSMLKTAHVPPITTTERMPYGTLILVHPPSPPFVVPKPLVTEVRAFPALHKALVAGTAGRGAREGERRAASAGGGRW
ncbi:hypothetical protein JCM10450v2_002813 [Rhodotorula kratochvilovae]